MNLRYSGIFLGILLLSCLDASAQRKRSSNSSTPPPKNGAFSNLGMRNIGPAFMSGRIADVAIHPTNESIWYVGVASGGVWKTVNRGTIWEPLFDDQSVYSIGCVAINPHRPEEVWVGTGENVGGRHMSFGDGVYRSRDGGQTWTNMGLPNSEHVSKIIIHPVNPNTIWVAAQGPLWSKGGDRGFYRSTDGGKSWTKTLGNNEWVGVTDIAYDPRNPDIVYAATWQRHRTVAAYMGGGPGSGIHKSYDGGQTWTQLLTGLPKEEMGKIGLAISPQNPDRIYAAIELNRRTGGVFMSDDAGGSWAKQSAAVAGATGPHYYQELYASPHQEGRLYLVDNTMLISDDHGKTFYRMNNESKHGDEHSVNFSKTDPNYVLVGTDGGLYESYDLTKSWRYVTNLPVTQFYKLAVDDTKPFYNLYGGTQDNSTQGGPSRTDNVHGIQNADWKIVLNWDGHQPATEPGNPAIMYGERQQGNLSRIDLTTGEVIDIQPQPGPGEDYERFNWDAPILVSPHKPTRLYFASQRLWKSEDRGDNWTALSDDLTRDQERLALPIMGQAQYSWDAAWDVLAMSNYNTITSIAESPKKAGLLYIGTDDGLIQVSENDGQSWRKIEVGSMPDVPPTAFVNDIKADLFDENTVYVCLDNHKYGDYQPYVYKSTDKGRSWSAIKGNLPTKTLVWRLVQDHERKDLLFLATEFGLYFTLNGGGQWHQIKKDVPTISFRDLAIQRRENDLVAASFGRGFYILDDYSFLRDVQASTLQQPASLFNTRNAWWYIPRPLLNFSSKKGSQGDQYFVADNPPFGAVLTYYLKDGLQTKKELRQEKEKSGNARFPGWEAVEAEANEKDPIVWLAMANAEGKVIRRISGPTEKGFHRVAWDLRYPSPQPIDNEGKGADEAGLLAVPGSYSATLYQQVEGKVAKLAGPVTFEVERLREGALEGADDQQLQKFWRRYEDLVSAHGALSTRLTRSMGSMEAIDKALHHVESAPGTFSGRVQELRDNLLDLSERMNGMKSKQSLGEKTRPTPAERLNALSRGVSNSTYGPTGTHLAVADLLTKELEEIGDGLTKVETQMTTLIMQLQASGAPWIEK